LKKKKKILIAGGTGFIGYHLAKFCLKKKWDITCFSKNEPKRIRKLNKIKYLKGDLYNKEDFRKINFKFDYVVNLGGYVDHSNKIKTYNSHFIGCKNLSNFFLNKNIESFVQMGSSGEYGRSKSPQKENINCRPISIYNRNLYRKKNFPVTILRLYQAYGPKQDINRLIPIVIDSCIKNKKFPCSNGKQYRDFIHVDDLVQSILKCFENKKAKGQIINIGTGKPKKIRNVINLIKNKIKSGQPQFGKIKLRPEETLKVYPKISKAKKILGWRPKIKFKNGLFLAIKSYQIDEKK